jgi:hypothetical protein
MDFQRKNKNKIYVFTGPLGNQYYRISKKNIYYDIKFPLEIALDMCYSQRQHFGPDNGCLNCISYASYNGIQLGICTNCIKYSKEIYKKSKKIYYKLDCKCSLNGMSDNIKYQLDNFKTMDGYMIMECESKYCIHNNIYFTTDFTKTSLSEKHKIKDPYKEHRSRGFIDLT